MSVPIAIALPGKGKDEENDNKENIPPVVKNDCMCEENANKENIPPVVKKDCLCGYIYYNVFIFGMPRFKYIATELARSICATFREPGPGPVEARIQDQDQVDKEMLIHRSIVYKSNLEQLHRMVSEARLLLIIIIIIIIIIYS